MSNSAWRNGARTCSSRPCPGAVADHLDAVLDRLDAADVERIDGRTSAPAHLAWSRVSCAPSRRRRSSCGVPSTWMSKRCVDSRRRLVPDVRDRAAARARDARRRRPARPRTARGTGQQLVVHRGVHERGDQRVQLAVSALGNGRTAYLPSTRSISLGSMPQCVGQVRRRARSRRVRVDMASTQISRPSTAIRGSAPGRPFARRVNAAVVHVPDGERERRQLPSGSRDSAPSCRRRRRR